MRRPFLLLLGLLSTSAFGWTAPAYEKIASKGAALAPPDMKLVIDKYAVEYRRGLQDASQFESEARHTYFVQSQRGMLRSSLENEVRAAVKSMRERQPLSQFVERLGRIAHFVADANNPFHVSEGDRRLTASQTDFERYFESRLSKFPTVFYGLANPFNLGSYLDHTLRRTATYYPLLSEEYFRYGERRTSAEFDDRSTAFGVAALSYSHSVSDLVNIYYFIWKEAGGDVRTAAAMRSGNLFLNQYD